MTDTTTKLTEAVTLLRGCSEAMGFEDTEHGQLVLEWLAALDTKARALSDAVQDSMENVPFASVGGLEKRGDMTAPSYIPEADRAAYFDGYRAAAEKMYGPDWRTCSFSWSPAITIPGTMEETP